MRGDQSQESWKASRLALVPDKWRERVARDHARRIEAAGGELSGPNTWLRELTEALEGLRLPLDASDLEVCELADKLAREAWGHAQGPFGWRTLAELRGVLDRMATRYGIAPPAAEDGPAVARLTDPAWWRRQLRKAQGRKLERTAIRWGYVHRRGQVYASDATVNRRTLQRRRNAATLEATEAVNLETGDAYTLAELAALSVSNPRIRRGELMVRIRGFEEVAELAGDVAEFVTLTCPSRFHPKRVQGGRVEENPKWDGSTPREAQAHLVKTWANARAKLNRAGVRVYGFRIAEPHHDACPHWHLLLFVEPGQADTLRAVLTEHALRVDGEEPGAQKQRVLFRRMDPGQGGAAGYVAKYVSKNIDGGGYVVQTDLEGNDAFVPTSRVEAWASTWGIRQFQQIGGPPVGVWRELRRTTLEDGASDRVKAAHAAADAADWCAFTGLVGGPSMARCPRKDLRIRTAYSEPGTRYNYSAGAMNPAPLTRYGEQAPGTVYGVQDQERGRVHPSRRFRWEMRRRHAAHLAGIAGPRTRVNNCSQGSTDHERNDQPDHLEPAGSGEAGGPGSPRGLGSGPDSRPGMGRGIRPLAALGRGLPGFPGGSPRAPSS